MMTQAQWDEEFNGIVFGIWTPAQRYEVLNRELYADRLARAIADWEANGTA